MNIDNFEHNNKKKIVLMYFQYFLIAIAKLVCNFFVLSCQLFLPNIIRFVIKTYKKEK